MTKFVIILFTTVLGLFCCSVKNAEEPASSNKNIWRSGAEEVIKKDRLYFSDCGDIEIWAAKERDTINVFKGKYSSKLDAKNKYTFVTKFKPEQGDYYYACVWVKDNPKNIRLIANNKEQYITGHDTYQRKNGWAQILVQMLVKKPSTNLTIQVVNATEEIVYVDEFQVFKMPNEPVIGVKNSAKLPEINLEIKDKDFDEIKRIRLEALKKGILEKKNKKWFKAKINGEKCKIKLKGDWVDHLSDHKWSFRIRTEGKSKKIPDEFSIMNPLARGYMLEWMNHKLMTKEGLSSTRYQFRFVRINGVARGVYAMEHHFTPDLMKANDLNTKGEILKFTEDHVWEIRIDTNRNPKSGFPYLLAADIDTYSDSEGVDDASFLENGQLLDRLRFAKYDAVEMFDLDYEAKYFAMVDLFSAYHGAHWHNARFYIDPTNHKLYQLGFDLNNNHITKVNDDLMYKQHYFVRMYRPLFSNLEFKKKYIKYLTAFSQPEYLADFIQENKEEHNSLKQALLFEYDSLPLSFHPIVKRAEFIRDHLNKMDTAAFFNRAYPNLEYDIAKKEIELFENITIKAYRQSSNKKSDSVLITNLYRKPIQIVEYQDPKSNKMTSITEPKTIEGYAIGFTEFPKGMVSLPKGTKKIVVKCEQNKYEIDVRVAPYPFAKFN